ncbi:FK506-binding protein 15 [Stylophora pistillata]|uniref:peptidylprolyl isomerase n=1 Tax=Stylophora pistillata TaxID=50429 RepID=A0A2B4SAV1_STYPI|nr:FK506-binding protein 15 [Stylophora pistillata]
MGAVESSTEENSVIRFVDSVEIRYGEDTSIVTQENGWNEHVSGEDWISHVPKVDDSHGIATVAPADSMLCEGSYEDYEIIGDTAVQTIEQEEFGIVGTTTSDLNFEEDHSPGLKYNRSSRRTSCKKKPIEALKVQDGGKLRSRDCVLLSHSSSKLASLFGQDKASFLGGNESLTYTAPKQPKKEKPAGASQTSSGETTLLFATAVHAYKYVNGQYASQGKLGAAVLANHPANDVQGSNYASFYDDQRQTWSICFESDKNITDFAKQVGLLKFNSASSNLCTQDLSPGDGLGWEQGVIGMKKGGKRLIAIPSTLAYGEKGVPSRVPPNSSLLFEVEVLRIKSSRESNESPVTVHEPSPSQNTDQLPDILSEPSGTTRKSDSVSSLSSPGDSGIKGRTASITEQLSQSPGKNTDKARLLARMSKMGKNPLFLPGAVAAEPENDELGEQEQEIPTHAEASAPEATDVNATSPPPFSSNPHPSVRSKPLLPPRPAPQVHPEVHQPVHNPAPPAQPYQQTAMNPQPMMQPAFTPQQQVALYQPPASMGYPMMGPQPQMITAPYSAPPPPPPPQPTANDAMVPVLMAETRQQQGEIRMSIGKLSDKIDELSNKVERHQQNTGQLGGQLTQVGQMGIGAFGNPQAAMEAAVLVHNITRIVQENEKVKAEGSEKSRKIETLNDKISELLQKSQRFVEHSNTMLEQRSDSLQVNTAQSQARVLSLEQEKITMSSELTSAKTHLAALQNEVASLRQREAELSGQLSKATSETDKYRNDLMRAKDSHTESAEESDKLKLSLKEEKQTRKRLESKVEHIEEELNDLKHEKENLEKGLTDRKKKHAADKKKFEEELEELRSQQEEELRFLKEKHRKEKHSSGTVTAQQVAQAEAELETRWTEKAEKMVAQTEEKWKRRFQEVTDEKEETVKKLAEFQEKVSTLKAGDDKKGEKIKDLQEKLEDLVGIREKYKRLQDSQGDRDSQIEALRSSEQELVALQAKYQEVRSRTLKMKEQYEERLSSAEEERESAVSEAYSKGLKEGKEESAMSKEKPPANVTDEVKRIMNTLFYMLRSEFEANDSYTGSEVMAVILKTIKEVTMKLVSGKSSNKEESEEEEEEEDEDEEEAEDEGGEEDEEEDNEEKEDKEEDEKEKEVGIEEETLVGGEATAKKESKEEDSEKSEEEVKPEETVQDVGGVDEDEKDEEKESNESVTEEGDEIEGTVFEQSKDEVESNEMKNEETKDLTPNGEIKEKVDSVAVGDSTDGNLESSNDREINENTDNLDNSSEDSFQGNQLDVPSLEELSAETAKDARADTSEKIAPFVSESVEDPFSVSEEKREQRKEEHETQDVQVPTSQSGAPGEAKLKSLFGDDEHDDVEFTFGSLSKKKEEEKPESPPPRAVPPPLFDDDDDDDDDLNWFK